MKPKRYLMHANQDILDRQTAKHLFAATVTRFGNWWLLNAGSSAERLLDASDVELETQSPAPATIEKQPT